MKSTLIAGAAACILASGGILAASSPEGPVDGPQRPLTSPGSVVFPSGKDAAPIPLADLFASANAAGAVWSADGNSVIYASTEGGALNLWRQPVDGGSAERISDFLGPRRAFRLAPDGQSLVFQADVGGRAINDLFVVRMATGEVPDNLTTTPDVSETYPVFSPDGQWLAYAARGKSEASDNLVIMDWRTRQTRQLTREPVPGVHWAPIAFAQDGHTLIANRYDYSMEFAEVHQIDTQTGAVVQKTPEGRYASASAIAPDGSRAAISTDAGRGLRQAATLDLRTGRSQLLQPSQWEQTATDLSSDGRQVLFVTNENGRHVVQIHDLATGENRRLQIPEGTNAAGGYVATLPRFSPDGRRVLFPHSAGSVPTDYWVIDVDDGRPRRLTRLSALDAPDLPETEIVNYQSDDGTVISAVMWKPIGLVRNGSAPAVVIAHGGPTGQSMDQFHQVATALASRGYVVLAPNFRGSTGYGQAFVSANKMDLGGGDLADVVAGVGFLAKTGYVDGGKVGIYGGSYGGYMTLMALAKTDVFATGVNLFGVVNWHTMWERGALDHQRYQSGLIGEPRTHADVYERASPMTYLEGLTEPLLVLHGENDPLVPVHESRQVIEYLQARGREVEAHIYEEEGHGFVQPANQQDALRRTIEWFDRHIGHAQAQAVEH